MNIKEEALRLISQGYNIIPVGKDKKPCVKWTSYKTGEEKVTPELFEKWHKQFNPKKIGLILDTTNLVVVDLDEKEHPMFDKLGSGPLVKTSRGHHFYFTVPNKIGLGEYHFKGFDVKATGYMVIPPSTHEDGAVYEWIRPLNDQVLELPDFIMELIKPSKNTTTKLGQPTDKIFEGSRNTSLLRIAGSFLGKFSLSDFPKIHDYLQFVNREKCIPPLETEEVTSIFDSIVKKELGKRNLQTGIELRTIGQIYDTEANKQEFLVEHLVPFGITSLSGHPGVGKSWVMFELAKSVAEGSDFLGKFKTLKRNVAIIDGESGESELQRRLHMMQVSRELPIYFHSTSDLDLMNESSTQSLITKLLEKEVGLVIFDPMVSFHTGNENSAEDMQQVMRALQQFTKNGIAVLFVHHHRKETLGTKSDAGQGMRGSSVIFSRLDSALVIKSKKEVGTATEMTLSHDKLRSGKKHDAFTILLEEDESGLKLTYGGDEKNRDMHDAVQETITALLLERDYSRTEIITVILAEKLGKSRTVDTVLLDMEKRKEIGSRTEKRSKVYSINRN